MQADLCKIEHTMAHNDLELVSLNSRPEGSIVKINNVQVGGEAIVVMAGPCAVEFNTLMKDLDKIAEAVGRRIHKL